MADEEHGPRLVPEPDRRQYSRSDARKIAVMAVLGLVASEESTFPIGAERRQFWVECIEHLKLKVESYDLAHGEGTEKAAQEIEQTLRKLRPQME